LIAGVIPLTTQDHEMGTSTRPLRHRTARWLFYFSYLMLPLMLLH